MPFDYNSFLQGVQTGLRLGRTSPGRVPPMPPVPSGRYILTESGEHILTEKKNHTGATIIGVGTYEATRYVNEQVYDHGSLSIKTWSGASAPEIQMFWMIDTDYMGEPRLFIFCDSSAYDPSAWGNYLAFKFTGKDHGFLRQTALLTNFGEDYGIRWSVAVNVKCRPDNLEIFYGTRSEAVYWAAHAFHLPMITEGG